MDEDQFFKEKTDSNIFKQVIYKYLPFWPLFVITVSISLLVAYIDVRSKVPMYVATAKVLLKDPQKGGTDSKVLDALNIFGEKKIVDNEIVVLRSPDLMSDVVKQLDLYALVYNQGNVRTEELYSSNSPVKFIAVDKENYNLWGTYYFSIDWNNKIVHIDNKNVPFDSTVVLGNNVIRLKINHSYNHNVTGKNYYVQFMSYGGAAGGIVGGLSISPYSYSSTILNVSLRTPVPEKGRDILTRLFELYNINGVEDKNEIADKTVHFIDDRLDLVSSQLDSVERKIAGFQSKTSAVDLSTQASAYFAKVTDLDKQNSEIDLKLDGLKDLELYLQHKGNRTVPSLMLFSDGTLSGLLDKLYTAETQVKALKSVTGEHNDAYILATAQIAKLRGDIEENMANIKNNLLTLKSQVNDKISANNYLLKQVPEQERVFLDISRQQAVKNNIYTYLLQKREETAISSVATTPDLKVVESASSYGPISPIAKNFYLEGLVIGLLAAAFLVLLKEIFSRKVLFRSEVENKMEIPILGELVQVTNKEPIVIMDGKRTVIAEQFRSIRTNLAFMGLNEKRNTLLITSSVSGEGKSFVAINLAISFTLTGKKVALMEMDLRKPKLSKILKVKKTPGISSYLAGKATVDQIIKQSYIPGLSVVSAGPIPPNPTELIQGEEFNQLMGELKQRFDYVIMDTAPVSPVTDAQLLQSFADINLLLFVTP